MTDPIFYSNPLEFQNSRQSTKITYLQQEIDQLQDHIKDLDEIIKLNKDALRLLSTQGSPGASKSKVLSQNDITASISDHRHSPVNGKVFNPLLENLQEENSRLLSIIDKLRKERALAQSRALLSEQICEEIQIHETEVVAELEEKIIELRKMLQDKEHFIQLLEKVKPFPYQEGVVVKFREVMDPTEQNIRLHEELNRYSAMLTKLAKEMNKLQQDKKDLAEQNTALINEMIKIRALLKHPNKSNHGFNILGKLKNAFNKSQIRNKSPTNSLLKLPDESSFLSSASKSPTNRHEYEGRIKKPSLFKPEKSNGLTSKRMDSPMRIRNPLLDMKLLEKINNLEMELDLKDKKLMVEMRNNEALSDELAKIKRTCADMVATNEILCKSNKKYQDKWDKFFHALEFYKSFYHKYIDLITSRKSLKRSATVVMPDIESLKKINDALNLELDLDLGKFTSPVNIKSQEERKEHNSIHNKEKISSKDKHEKKRVFEFTKEQSKTYLINLAKNFYNHAKMNNPSNPQGNEINEKSKKNISTLRAYRLKRAISNPLDYVFERKKDVFCPIIEETPKAHANSKKGKKMLEGEGHKRIGSGKIDNSFNDGLPKKLKLSSKKPSLFFKRRESLGDHLSFSIDAEEIDRVKAFETSFISSIDMLENLE